MSGLGFTEEQIQRYSRHILLQEVGGEGQKTLLGSSALVVGAGGLGSPALLYLAAAGVGRIGIADHDSVDLSNLQRQIIHSTHDLDKQKALSAQESISSLNPDCEIETIPGRITKQNAAQTMKHYDVVLDGSDNFPTRFLVADCCRMERVPLVSAAAVRFQGQLMTVLPGEGNPCYRCIFPAPPPPGLAPSCQEAGILGAVVGVMGTLQALEAIKVLLGMEGLHSHKLLVYDALETGFMTVMRKQDPHCPLCGREPTITTIEEYGLACEDQGEAHQAESQETGTG